MITIARKPLDGTVAETVLKHSTGGFNIEATRIRTSDNLNGGAYAQDGQDRWDGAENWRYRRTEDLEFEQPSGRWPSNVLLTPEGAEGLDLQTGHLHSAGYASDDLTHINKTKMNSVYAGVWGLYGKKVTRFGDSGGASRFFKVLDDE